MTSLKEIVQDLAAMVRRGAVTEAELKRLLQYVSGSQGMAEKPDLDTNAGGNTGVGLSAAMQPTTRSRRYAGRGSYGWVNEKRAEDLNLIAVLRLGGEAHRRQRLEEIEKLWGRFFSQADREVLPFAKEPRWQKTCEWAAGRLKKEGLAERPARGVLRLTQKGSQEAQARGQRLPP